VRYQRQHAHGAPFNLADDDRRAAAVVDGVVAFEVDSFDENGRGWLVNIVGRTKSAETPGEVLLPFNRVSGRRYERL
jgi:hypothetical protein